MRARGIDPGDTIGWCDLEREAPGVFRYVASGTWEASQIQRGQSQIPRLLSEESAGGKIHVVSIETPEEMHPNEIGARIHEAMRDRRMTAYAHGARIVQTVRKLLETRALAERIACIVTLAGVSVREPTAAECRKALGVRFGAQRGKGQKLTVDQQIARIIPIVVRGWPARSNPHVRDAAAAALWALGAADAEAAIEQAKAHSVPAVKAAMREAEHAADRRGFKVPPPGAYGPGDYGPDSFGGSDFE